jgi:diadenosine tetraphosphate (Ap4A) HIT family hydrolase
MKTIYAFVRADPRLLFGSVHITNLENTHLVQAMDDVKRLLLESHCPETPASAVHSGYHRGRRQIIGNIYYPDIISVHHLHLHVIVKPSWFGWLFKYPTWLSLMWKSDHRVIQEVQQLSKRS